MTQFKMPKVAANMEEGSISKWLVKEGEKIEKGQPLVEILSDKVNVAVDSPINGFLKQILVAEGEVAKVGEPIAELADELQNDIKHTDEGKQAVVNNIEDENKGKEPEVKRVNTEKTSKRIKVSPAAKKLIEEKGLKLEGIAGSGPGGRIILRDIEKALEQKPKTEIYETPQPLPLQGLRKIIAERMTLSYRTAPHVTLVMQVDASEMQGYLNKLKKQQKKVTVTSLITKVTAAALKKYPIFKTLIKNNEIITDADTNIGIAVDIDEGLIVPVIPNVDKKGLDEIDNELKDLVKKAKENKLNPEQTTGGSFTISNLGMFDVEAFTPIINPPQCAILGVGKVVEKPAVENGSVVIRPMMTLSLSFDHRIADGALAARFLKTIKGLLEDPAMLLL